MQLTQFVFFSGKGGVGKTSMACASAVSYANNGLRTLIVTTDPASNLSDVFGQQIGHKETPIDGAPGLWAMEIDPDRATEEYRERIIAPMREVMPESVIKVVEEQFNSPCTTEIAAFDRFVDFMDRPDYDVVIFDTAPTGHTIRLLQLPVDWSKHIEESAKGSGHTCMGPVQAIQSAKEKYDKAIGLLRDPERTSFVFVMQPEETPIAEAVRSSGELAAIGIHSSEVIVNGVLPPEQCISPFFTRRKEMQDQYLAVIEERFRDMPRRLMYLQEGEIAGVERLRRVGELLNNGNGAALGEVTFTSEQEVLTRVARSNASSTPVSLTPLLPHCETRLVFFAGKGGVGKTVSACATAVFLAEGGYSVLLVSTDPASHLSEEFGQVIGSDVVRVDGVGGLHAARVDQKQAVREYKKRILDEASGKYTPDMIEAMKEELESPCTEEMAAFEKFLQYATRIDFDVIIFDTAPTGHTLRLLELPMDWDRQLEVMVAARPDSSVHTDTKQRYDEIIAFLKDPKKTTFIFVVYPENTPIVEAHRASLDLREAGIPTGMIIANQVLTAKHCTTDFFVRRLELQQKYLGKIEALFGVPIAMMPMLDREVKGLPALREMGRLLWTGSATKGQPSTG